MNQQFFKTLFQLALCLGQQEQFGVKKWTLNVLHWEETRFLRFENSFGIYLWTMAFGIFTNAADSIKLGGDVVFYLRYNAKSKWRRYCDEIEACTEQYTRGGIIIRQLG